MAWTYSNWRTYAEGTQARLDRLNLHIGELTDAVSLELGSDGKSKSANNITRLLELLDKERTKLETRVARRAGAGTSQIRFRDIDQDGRVDRCD